MEIVRGRRAAQGRHNMELKKEIFFPIEIKPREFVSRALLGATFADHGYRVYIGTKHVVNAAVLSKTDKSGVYFYKGTRPKASTQNLLLKVDAFCVLDEEMGIAVRNLDEALEQRLKGMRNVDKFFTISRHVADATIRICPESKPKVSVTGWPRVDTWRPEMAHLFRHQAQIYRQRFGEFVLFTSDFGTLSQSRVDSEITRLQRYGYPDNYISNYAAKASNTIADFNRFCEDIHRYDARPEAPLLIVRPHPAEDHAIWEKRLHGLTRVKVVYEGEVSGWLQASRMLVHRGCTTAVQARVGGKPAFFWAPKNSSPATEILPYKVSTPLESLSELLDLWDKPDAAMHNAPIPQYQLELGKTLSIERIFDEVDVLGITPAQMAHRGLEKRLHARLKGAWRSLIQSNTYLARVFISTKRTRKLQSGFHAAELTSFLADAFPEKTYNVRQVSLDLLLLEAEQS